MYQDLHLIVFVYVSTKASFSPVHSTIRNVFVTAFLCCRGVVGHLYVFCNSDEMLTPSYYVTLRYICKYLKLNAAYVISAINVQTNLMSCISNRSYFFCALRTHGIIK